MLDLISQLQNMSAKKPIDPRDIFMSLNREPQYQYPRDVQSEVWRQWFNKRDVKDTIIKMNTGSGKTVVGLMILQSCLNESKGPAIYVVPDHYLQAQVCAEAEKLGIRVTTDRDDYYYTKNQAILITTVHTLVNGRSVFGMRNSGNYPIGSILLDDVHACLDTITEQFSIQIPSEHPLYSEIISLVGSAWKSYNQKEYTGIVEFHDPQMRALLPFWVWQKHSSDIENLLMQYNNNEVENRCVCFSFPLIEDCLHFCNCIITARGIEVTPKGIPISKIKSFNTAIRRIFMSATLADDSVFVSELGIKKIPTIITPEKANDIGDRLILFPQHLNSLIDDTQIRDKVLSIAQQYNVVVIVPSHERGKFWDDAQTRIVDKTQIENIVNAMKRQHVGLTVFVNRYDGIDLPGDACRLLVIDGLPPLRTEYDKYVHSIDFTSTLLLREQIQKIEQGMGRGVRSSSDSCCIVLMGNKLADVLLRNNGVAWFSNTTAEQYKLSEDMWDLLKKETPSPSVDDIFQLADYSLKRQTGWQEISKERLSAVNYASEPNIDAVTLSLRVAFDKGYCGEWKKAIESIDEILRDEGMDESSKGYLLQVKADYMNFIDPIQAQQILMSAHKRNHATLVPIDGIRYEKQINNSNQSVRLKEYISSCQNTNEYILHVNAVLDDLSFCPHSDGRDTADDFECAFRELGAILGFLSSRPEKETNGSGPDNLWAIGAGDYLVVECKSEATTATISKRYCDQLGGSVRWFNSEYEGGSYKPIPIIIYPTNTIDAQATPVEGMKVITPDKLTLMKKQVHNFVSVLVQNENWKDIGQIEKLLVSFKLRGCDLIKNYTVALK